MEWYEKGYYFDDYYGHDHNIDIYVVYWYGPAKACLLEGKVWVWDLRSDWEKSCILRVGGSIRGNDIVPYAIVICDDERREFVGKVGDWDDYDKLEDFLYEVLYFIAPETGFCRKAGDFLEQILLDSEVLVYSLWYVTYHLGIDWEPSDLWMDLKEFLNQGLRGISHLEWLVNRHGKRIRGFNPYIRKRFIWERARNEVSE